MRGVQLGQSVSLAMDSRLQKYRSRVTAIAPASSEMEPGLLPIENYKGITGQNFYVVTAVLPNAEGLLRPGMAGTAKVLITRRSLATLVWKQLHDFVDRTVW
jgi:multidrug resistance efflux pump